jgi:transcriptional regulator with PAS, ATPase and Fis domain
MNTNEIITADRRMKELIHLARTVAGSKATVLIQGESGTGKELMASLIHECSSRANKPFVAINCAAIPENLLESELFGYERGAFTGAVTSKAGKFEFAQGGTILLDEISEMDVRLQAKLLRVIQEGEVDRIGGRRPVPVDVRIIATTNRNLADCVKKGTFREDLFYRLNVVNLTMPTLRERIGDVRLLTRYFMETYSARNGKQVNQISEQAAAMLEHVIERAVITAQSNVLGERDVSIMRQSQDFGAGATLAADMADMSGGAPSEDRASRDWIPGRTLDDIERRVILEALSYHQGNRTHTARALGISIRTLRNKLADYRQMGIRV